MYILDRRKVFTKHGVITEEQELVDFTGTRAEVHCSPSTLSGMQGCACGWITDTWWRNMVIIMVLLKTSTLYQRLESSCDGGRNENPGCVTAPAAGAVRLVEEFLGTLNGETIRLATWTYCYIDVLS